MTCHTPPLKKSKEKCRHSACPIPFNTT